MKEDKRTNRINLHLNNREMELFREKAKNYRQMSAMIRDAVAQFDDTGTVKRIESLNKLADLITDFNREISKQGGNLNQITKRANELIYSSELNESYYKEVFLPQILLLQKTMKEIKKQQSDIFKRLLNL
ncbi:MAG: mobilization protein [Bacteroidaceae bacterium]